ncbi:MAG: hypothetical protein KBT50_06200 [Cycloclasticus sp.]|nr:hypothetical protein [Cycloclasticus sp.]MBQ0790196.1 hypothetical protein [Cycloclasticus sp.]
MMLFKSKIALITLALLLSQPAFSLEKMRWYSIEYIVFEHNNVPSQLTEKWTKEPLQMPEHARELNTRSGQPAFSPLAINQQQLHGVYKRLMQLSSYTPLHHGGWIQPVDETSSKLGVQILQQLGHNRLEGSITFHRGNYLHLDIDLQLSEPSPVSAIQNESSYPTIAAHQRYRLIESRRIKSSESNYFDHPRLGVIAIVEAIDSPLAAVETNDLINEKQLQAGAFETRGTNAGSKINEN